MSRKRIIIGVTGATGAPIAVKVLQLLREFNIETHLVVSKWAQVTLHTETGLSYQEFSKLANVVHDYNNLGASIASGSFVTEGMMIVPCSMKTLSGIRTGFGENLISRAADVVLKEGRKLLLVPRETPFNRIHLENMLYLSKMGVSILPPVLTFYNDPQTIDDCIMHLAIRTLDQFNLHVDTEKRWEGLDYKKK